jgi:uracil-DNA glycosylase family 4
MVLESLTLNDVIRKCDHCLLRASKGLGIGNVDASMLLLAQNPGNAVPQNPKRIPFELHLWDSQETTKGSEILRSVMTDAGFRLEDFYVTNAMKCEGKAHDEYVNKCADWLESELVRLPNLKLIVALGNVAGKRIGLTQSFKCQWYESRLVDERASYRWISVYVNHPASLLYPDGVSRLSYENQWAFVRAVFRRLNAGEGIKVP